MKDTNYKGQIFLAAIIQLLYFLFAIVMVSRDTIKDQILTQTEVNEGLQVPGVVKIYTN